MKKLLTLAAAGLLGLSAYAQYTQDQLCLVEDRSGWKISGCSEQNHDAKEGGFDEIKDGNNATYWHSTWSGNHPAACPHYFVVDRGEAAASNPIAGFGYLTRQNGQNGRATAYRIFVLDNIDGLSTVSGGSYGATIGNNHDSLGTFLTGKESNLAATGTFDYADGVGLKKVAFDSSKSGRYVLFVVDGSVSNNEYATCAEFYLYLQGTALNFKRSDGSVAASTATLFLTDGSVITCPEEIGSGSGTVGNGASIDITIKDNINPFKLVSARHQNQWAKSTAAGMAATPNSGSYDDGSWYLEVPQTDGTVKIFNIDNFKFQQSHTGNLASTPIPLAANDSDAGTFTIARDDSGAETIRTSDVGFNIQGNTVSYWTGFDIGSLWFMVYDKDAYVTNKPSYSTAASHDKVPDSPFKKACTAAKAKQAEVADNTDTSEEFVAARNALDAAIAKAAAARFGKAGVNIPEIISELTLAVNSLTPHPTLFNTIKANGDAFITTFGLTGSEAANAWATASAIEDDKKTMTAVNTLRDAYSALLTAASRTADNLSFTFKNARTGEHYMTPTNDQSMLCSNEGVNTDKRTFTIHHANDNGFYLLNEYTNKYVQSGANASNQAHLVTNRNAATVYSFKGYDYESAQYLIAAYNQTGTAEMLHSDANDAVVNWESASNSSWSLSSVTKEQAANEHLAGAKYYYNHLSTGSGLGQYSVANPEDAEAALAVDDSATEQAKRDAASTLFNTELTLNMPQPGHFYRFQNVDNASTAADKVPDEAKRGHQLYISSNHIGNKLEMVLEDSDPNKAETVFYLDENNRLVALSDGLCFGKFMSGDGDNSWKTLLHTSEKAATVAFTASGVEGKYNIKPSDGRLLYGLWNTIDCASSDAQGLRWNISQVKWLPIPGSDQTYTTLTSPVALKLRDYVTAYTASVVNGRVVLSAIEGNVIPANTPVVLHCAASADRNQATGLVYLEIVDGGDAIASDLKGSYLSEAKEADKHYAVINGHKFSALAADANVPGFKAHIEVSDENDHALTTAAIEEILTSGKVYSIKNTENIRGYIYHNAEQAGIWATSKANISVDDAAAAAATDASYQWTVVSDNAGKYYLYNLGAKKFASAFTKPGDSNSSKAEFCWTFSDVPTAIEIQAVDWAPTANIFNIYGGQNTATARPAGMMIIKNDTNPVAGVSGLSAQDGNGFIFTEVADATAEGVPTAETVEAVKAEMVAEYDAAKANVDNWDEEVAGNGVGYFTADGFAAYSGAITAVDANADAEAKHYAVVRAQIAAGNNVSTFVADAVYNIMNADGQYYRATLTKNEDNSYITSSVADDLFTNEVIAYNWLATVNEAGAVSLTHSFQTAAAAAPVSRAAEGNYDTHVCFLVKDATPAYDGFGNVTLGEGMVVKAINRTENNETTAIEELSLDSKAGADVIYDLQGRRVNKATHGVYIVNGKKIYVK